MWCNNQHLCVCLHCILVRLDCRVAEATLSQVRNYHSSELDTICYRPKIFTGGTHAAYVHCSGKPNYLQLGESDIGCTVKMSPVDLLEKGFGGNFSVLQVASWLDCPPVFHPSNLHVVDLIMAEVFEHFSKSQALDAIPWHWNTRENWREWPFLASLLPTPAPKRQHFLLWGHCSCQLKQHHLKIGPSFASSIPPSVFLYLWRLLAIGLVQNMWRRKKTWTLVRNDAAPLSLLRRKLLPCGHGSMFC